jgi:hypothetical protein
MLARTGQRKWSVVGLVRFLNPFSIPKKIAFCYFVVDISPSKSL